ncbi:MAG: hypothetical protein Q4G68_06580 [Planctomycetia bacterium]|nr:hypothetical protein [Planctomycetia bacterium]
MDKNINFGSSRPIQERKECEWLWESKCGAGFKCCAGVPFQEHEIEQIRRRACYLDLSELDEEAVFTWRNELKLWPKLEEVSFCSRLIVADRSLCKKFRCLHHIVFRKNHEPAVSGKDVDARVRKGSPITIGNCICEFRLSDIAGSRCLYLTTAADAENEQEFNSGMELVLAALSETLIESCVNVICLELALAPSWIAEIFARNPCLCDVSFCTE